MTTPNQHELAAAREILDVLVVSASKPYQRVDADGLASIIAKHRSEEVKELQRKANQLLEAFRHRHVNNGQDDACKQCGLDLRNEIHAAMKGQQ